MLFSYKNKNIFYRKIGKGEKTIVLIHGFPEDGSIFDPQVDFLSSHFQLIIPDLPGAGKSEYNDQLNSMEDFAGAIIDLLLFEKIQNIYLLGHSMGGYIALAIEALNAQFTKAFGLIHSSALADTIEKKENRKKSIEFIIKNGSLPFVKKAIPSNFTDLFVEKNKAVIDELIVKASHFPPKGLQRFYEIMIDRPDRTEILQSSSKPVFFFLGEEDQAATLKDLLPQVKLPAVADIHIVKKVAHMGMLEAPQQLNKAILDFVHL